MEAKDIIIYLAVKYNGDTDKICGALKRKEEVDFDEVKSVVENLDCDVITILDDEYPVVLRERCPKPPLALFYKGDVSLIKNERECVAIVGSRNPSEYGLEQAGLMAETVANSGQAVITGGAKGIDAKVITKAGKKAVVVLGSGLNRPYPKDNEKLFDTAGLLLSEYPPNCEPQAKNFPMRNRIIAGLARGVAVAEATERSGTLITVAYATQMGKDVGAVPFPNGSDTVNNKLILEGAMMLVNDGKSMMLGETI